MKPYTPEQINKIGYTLVYLSKAISPLTKTKALKLLYLLDEVSIKKFGIPFLNINYKVWKFGPVNPDIFIELCPQDTKMLSSFIKISDDGLKPNVIFCDDEFSDNDINTLDFVINYFGNKTAKELVDYTHAENKPWRNAAINNNILDDLLAERISSTEFDVLLTDLIQHDPVKMLVYQEYKEMF